MKRATGALLSVVVPIACAVSCTHDYGQFDTEGQSGSSGSGGDGASGGSSSGGGGTASGGKGGTSSGGGTTSGGSGGTTAGGNGGTTAGGNGGTTSGGTGGTSTGGSGGSACTTGQKECNSNCVPNNDPTTGCAATSCSACVVPNATAACAGTPPACAVGACSGNFVDCNGLAGDGCEADLTQPTTKAYGSCTNDCSLYGLADGFVCLTGPVCGCNSPAQCKASNGGNASCA